MCGLIAGAAACADAPVTVSTAATVRPRAVWIVRWEIIGALLNGWNECGMGWDPRGIAGGEERRYRARAGTATTEVRYVRSARSAGAGVQLAAARSRQQVSVL